MGLGEGDFDLHSDSKTERLRYANAKITIAKRLNVVGYPDITVQGLTDCNIVRSEDEARLLLKFLQGINPNVLGGVEPHSLNHGHVHFHRVVGVTEGQSPISRRDFMVLVQSFPGSLLLTPDKFQFLDDLQARLGN